MFSEIRSRSVGSCYEKGKKRRRSFFSPRWGTAVIGCRTRPPIRWCRSPTLSRQSAIAESCNGKVMNWIIHLGHLLKLGGCIDIILIILILGFITDVVQYGLRSTCIYYCIFTAIVALLGIYPGWHESKQNKPKKTSLKILGAILPGKIFIDYSVLF